MLTNDKPERDKLIRDMIKNGVQAAVGIAFLVFWFGGPETRAWMLGFVWGMFGLSGDPNVHAAAQPPETTEPAGRPPLRLLGHRCHAQDGFEICEGEVRNETDHPLENVVAEVKFQDRYGTFVTSGEAMINYQPLMPGQTSAFSVYTTSNPQIWHFTMSFRKMFGEELKAAR